MEAGLNINTFLHSVWELCSPEACSERWSSLINALSTFTSVLQVHVWTFYPPTLNQSCLCRFTCTGGNSLRKMMMKVLNGHLWEASKEARFETSPVDLPAQPAACSLTNWCVWSLSEAELLSRCTAFLYLSRDSFWTSVPPAKLAALNLSGTVLLGPVVPSHYTCEDELLPERRLHGDWRSVTCDAPVSSGQTHRC